MDKRTIVTATVAIFTTAALLAATAVSAMSAPGASDDPLVSKSYVDSKFSELANLIGSPAPTGPGLSAGTPATAIPVEDELLAEIMERMELFYGGKAAASYAPVSALAGQTILGAEGSEIILRSGRATAKVPGANGLVNITTGSDVLNGIEIPPNNMIIVPRDDGRGVTAVTDAWFLVKGDYRFAED